jgi:hypothetical protein
MQAPDGKMCLTDIAGRELRSVKNVTGPSNANDELERVITAGAYTRAW